MSGKSFWESGHRPTLIMAFLYFDIAFMVWNMLGPLAPIIAKELILTPAEKGFMVAVPTLAGAVLRLVNGFLVDRIGQKVTGAIGQVVVIAGLFAAWFFGVNSLNGTIAVGVVLGFAGAAFAVALPLASRWYPPEHQGKAMGIAGMGNSGTVFAALFAPLLAKAFGWNNVLGLALIPLVIVFIAYMVLVKDSPDQPPAKSMGEYVASYFGMLREGDAWWFMLFYGVTFGGFVGLGGSLPLWFTGELAMSPIQAGYATAACVFAGSLVRPFGGALADRIGGIRTLSIVYMVASVLLVGIAFAPIAFAAMFPLFFAVMATLGIGNGAVFQLVPQRFRHQVGIMTGLVGFGGGLGGFYLASSLGLAKQWTGSASSGFLIFAALALIALAGLTSVKKRWRTTWGAAIQGVRI
ncbi:NarK/NasA family nitrate transporter [Sphingobium phenoxybenzoativorans]|jgi:NNP family nitrate/nitrite transporter-like MFS transporter|uniref:NarK/NasA family nitrate transporter n=1 Tax=Sphingobium phenoxybenzoativorans TaxID=1592790 RepID=A0A975KA66_9SPHN|nr:MULTISPECIES: MFS transporter [Sphingobium]QUT07625.1 NarK/NasA family nitrate transporter [Sphingobium phenoxybenzoativorans]